MNGSGYGLYKRLLMKKRVSLSCARNWVRTKIQRSESVIFYLAKMCCMNGNLADYMMLYKLWNPIYDSDDYEGLASKCCNDIMLRYILSTNEEYNDARSMDYILVSSCYFGFRSTIKYIVRHLIDLNLALYRKCVKEALSSENEGKMLDTVLLLTKEYNRIRG